MNSQIYQIRNRKADFIILIMFEHLNRQRKQKNWKILNLNFSNPQEQHQYNRSIVADSSKKYCPRKQTSKDKIFSKSKQRLNLSQAEYSEKSIASLKISAQVTDVKTVAQISKENWNVNQGKKMTVISRQKQKNNTTEGLQEYKIDASVIKNSNQKNPQIQVAKNYEKLKLKICDNTQEISRVKQEFQQFKLQVLDSLKVQKQFFRQQFQRAVEELERAKKKIYDQAYNEVYAQFQQKNKSIKSSPIQSRKNSAEIKLQEIFKLEPEDRLQFENTPQNFVNLKNFGDLQTFGDIQKASIPQNREFGSNQPYNYQLVGQKEDMIEKNCNDLIRKVSNQNQVIDQGQCLPQEQQVVSTPISKLLELVEQSHKMGTQTEMSLQFQKRQPLIRGLKTFKSSENLRHYQNYQFNMREQQKISQKNLTSQYTGDSHTKLVAQSKHMIEDRGQMKRYSEILKKMNEVNKSKTFLQNTKTVKNKSGNQISQMSKFQGVMEKLKSQIKEFKSLSDTKDLKKIKFSDHGNPQKTIEQVSSKQFNIQRGNHIVQKDKIA